MADQKGIYHVWEYTDKRQRQLRMLTKKRFSINDPHLVPAVWNYRSSANQWGLRNCENGFTVMQCKCRVGTGMGDHG